MSAHSRGGGVFWTEEDQELGSGTNLRVRRQEGARSPEKTTVSDEQGKSGEQVV